jgi:two-component system, NtrC family, sensor kinase
MYATLKLMSDIILVVNTQDNQLRSLEILPKNSIYLDERSTNLVSQTVEAFSLLQTAKIWLTKVRQALEKKQTLNFDYNLSWMGEEVWFTASIFPTSDTSALWIARDVTERKQAEMARWQSQDHFRTIFQQAAVGINLVSLAGQFLQVNPRFCKILGYTESELLQLNWVSIIYPSDLGVYQEYVRRMFASESSNSIERRLLCKDGEVRWGNINISLMRNPQGIPQYFIAVVEEITQRKRTEIALSESEERFCGIFEQAAVGIQQISISGKFIEVNKRLCEIVGYTESELLGMTVNEIIYQDDVESYLKLKRQILACETLTSSIEKRLICKNGQLKWVKNSLSLVRNRKGTPEYFISVVEDISKRKQLEEALKVVRKKALSRERNKAKQLEIALTQLQRTQTQLVLSEKMASLGSLVAGVAHEINNPTSFIYGNIEPAATYAEQLLSLINLYQQHYPQPIGEISQELENIDLNFIAKDFLKLLNSMKVGAHRITEIVLSLRNFSHLDESNYKLADIHEGIDNTLLFLQHRLKKHQNIPEIKIIKDYGQLPKIKCYPGQLNQVFMNILCNAIDALEESFLREFREIHISTKIMESKIIISIADNGLGVKKEIQPKIFDPFFTTKPPGKGTGLGLSISYQIVVDRHGGEIKCHSVFGEGAEFVIELPIV